MLRSRQTIVGLLLPLALGVVSPAAPASSADLVGTHGDWKVYRHGTGDERLCFAAATPSEQSPPDTERQKPYVYVTAWPKAGIKAEISALPGFILKRGAEVKVEVAGTTFTLQADGDRAFVVEVGEELKLLEAMRRSKAMTVSASSATGETARDTYSLTGVTAAVQAVATICQ